MFSKQIQLNYVQSFHTSQRNDTHREIDLVTDDSVHIQEKIENDQLHSQITEKHLEVDREEVVPNLDDEEL